MSKIKMPLDDDAFKVVLDIGSQNCKAGFAGEDFPRTVLPSVVGRFRHPGTLDGFPEIYCGKEAILKRGLSNLTWPMQDGNVVDWDELEKLWHHIFYKELYVAPETSMVLHALHPMMPRQHREKLAEILFETFAIKSLYLASSPTLVLHASGRTTGLVWENGYSCSYTAPIIEGFPLKNAIFKSPINGETLTTYLQNLTTKLGYSFTTPFEIELLARMKAEICYVADDYALEMKKVLSSGDNKTTYTLPDGQNVFLTKELFMCPELMFQPSLMDLTCPSIIENMVSSVNNTDMDYRATMYGNVVMAGGSSMFAGLEKRLLGELSKRVKTWPGFKAAVDAMSGRSHAAWGGGSVLASLTSLHGFWITKEEYEDAGSDKVNHKLF